MRSPSTSIQPDQRPELGQAAGVEEGPAVGVAIDVPRLLEGGHVALPGEVVGQAVLGRVERAAQRLEALDHLDPERADRRVHAVEPELARGPHDPVLVAACARGRRRP